MKVALALDGGNHGAVGFPFAFFIPLVLQAFGEKAGGGEGFQGKHAAFEEAGVFVAGGVGVAAFLHQGFCFSAMGSGKERGFFISKKLFSGSGGGNIVLHVPVDGKDLYGIVLTANALGVAKAQEVVWPCGFGGQTLRAEGHSALCCLAVGVAALDVVVERGFVFI